MGLSSEVDDRGRSLAPTVYRMGAGRFFKHLHRQVGDFSKNHVTDPFRKTWSRGCNGRLHRLFVASVAQLVERRLVEPVVAGSSPVRRPKKTVL